MIRYDLGMNPRKEEDEDQEINAYKIDIYRNKLMREEEVQKKSGSHAAPNLAV